MSGKIIVSPIAPSAAPEIVEFFRSDYIKTDPICESMGGLESKVHDMWVLGMTGLGMSFEAIDTENGNKRVGVFLCVDHQKDVKDPQAEIDEKDIDEKIVKLLHLMGVMHPIVAKLMYGDLKKENYFEGVMLSVLSSYNGRGVEGLLAEAVEKKAREIGRDIVYICCNSEFNYQALAKRDYKLIHTLLFDDHKIDGKKVFNVKPPHVGLKSVIKVLDK